MSAALAGVQILLTLNLPQSEIFRADANNRLVATEKARQSQMARLTGLGKIQSDVCVVTQSFAWMVITLQAPSEFQEDQKL